MNTTELNENFDLTKTCRLCLNQNNELISIFGISCFELQYLIIINDCTSLKISENDNLPKNICLECVECLNKFHQFRKLAVNSELRLTDFLKKFSNNLNTNMIADNTNIKQEIASDEEPICPIKLEKDLLEEDLKVAEDQIENRNEFQTVVPFLVKSEESHAFEIESKIEIVEEKLVINENETDLDNYEKIGHDTSSSHLTKHKRCKKGEKTFNQLSILQSNKKTHTDEKSLQCKHCGKWWRKLSQLKIHERIHTGEKPYSCKHCEKYFAHLYGLKSHERTHTGEKPYKCDQCGKLFSLLATLKTHKMIHTGEKSFNCDRCGKLFTQISNLKRHLRSHTGEERS